MGIDESIQAVYYVLELISTAFKPWQLLTLSLTIATRSLTIATRSLTIATHLALSVSNIVVTRIGLTILINYTKNNYTYEVSNLRVGSFVDSMLFSYMLNIVKWTEVYHN